MIKKIFKYGPLTLGGCNINLPKGAQILHADSQKGNIFIWALVDPFCKAVDIRHFEVFGTGHNFDYDMGVSREHIGTVKMDGDNFIFHVFEYTGV
jgi:hypothetical protein